MSLFSVGFVKNSCSHFSVHALTIKIVSARDCVSWLRIPFAADKNPC